METIGVPKRRPVNSRRRVISQKPRINHSHHGDGLKFRFAKLMRDHTLRIDIRPLTVSVDRRHIGPVVLPDNVHHHLRLVVVGRHDTKKVTEATLVAEVLAGS